MEENQRKNPPWRPSKYDPAFCQIAIDFMGEGFSQTALAGRLGISKSTLYEWMETYPDFSDALSIAKPNRVLRLERDMLTTENSAVVNSRRFALINADAQEWRDTRVTENTHTAKVVYLDESDKQL